MSLSRERPFDITINVEGRNFNTSKAVLKSISGSLLASLDKQSEYFHLPSNTYCFDRDSNLFPSILAAHRDGEIHVPPDVCAVRFRKEMEFWKIPKSMITPCCWKKYYSVQEDLEILNKIIKTFPKETNTGPKNIQAILRDMNGDIDKGRDEENTDKEDDLLRHRLWLFLEEPRSSFAAKVWSFIYVFVALISVILNLIWLEPGLRVDPYLMPYTVQQNQTFNAKIRRLLLYDPHIVILVMDCFCTVFFTLELCIHFAVCPHKKSFMRDYLRSVKVIVAFSMLFSTVFEFRKDWLTTGEFTFIWFFIKSLNTLRILLVSKFNKLNSTFNVVFLSFISCKREICLLLVVLLCTIIIYGGMIFAFEMNSDMFPDTGTSMWWALITMTTIGYGDFHPTRPMGYIVGTLCAIEGLMIIALPIAVVASQFSKYKDRNDEVQKYLKDVKKEAEIEMKQTSQMDASTGRD